MGLFVQHAVNHGLDNGFDFGQDRVVRTSIGSSDNGGGICSRCVRHRRCRCLLLRGFFGVKIGQDIRLVVFELERCVCVGW